jgi:hypothetical protein
MSVPALKLTSKVVGMAVRGNEGIAVVAGDGADDVCSVTEGAAVLVGYGVGLVIVGHCVGFGKVGNSEGDLVG